VAAGDVIYVGTDDARVLRVDAEGEVEPLRGFDEVAGRDTWYAGSAVINGQRVGPPLGISAVAFAGDDVLVSASLDHFAAQGAIYRRPVDGHRPLVAVAGGLPEWIGGIADTGCIATHGSAVAIVDSSGNLYLSGDTGRSWSSQTSGFPPPSSVLIA
jgi:hypothetical protein